MSTIGRRSERPDEFGQQTLELSALAGVEPQKEVIRSGLGDGRRPFWVAVLAAGCWPSTSYFFVDNPVYAHPLRRPEGLGGPNNVATALLMIGLVFVGLLRVVRSGAQDDQTV